MEWTRGAGYLLKYQSLEGIKYRPFVAVFFNFFQVTVRLSSSHSDKGHVELTQQLERDVMDLSDTRPNIKMGQFILNYLSWPKSNWR